MSDALQAFREAILAALGHAPEVIEPGRICRFATGDRRREYLRTSVKQAIVLLALWHVLTYPFATFLIRKWKLAHD